MCIVYNQILVLSTPYSLILCKQITDESNVSLNASSADLAQMTKDLKACSVSNTIMNRFILAPLVNMCIV
jgi:hypothetical protein